jgi:hypothetical protein
MSLSSFFRGLFIASKEEAAHRLAYSNFIYESDIADERRIYQRIDKPFRGDCEDFAFTLKIQIGGDVWYVLLPDGQAHAVLVIGDKCYCNRYRRPMPQSRYQGEFLFIMKK